MRRVDSVIDTWYDSGAMPFAQFHYPFENEEEFEERFPADFICEAIDQTRGWFYTLLAESTLLFDTSSYRNCVCLGLILDPEGQKMSKSRGNVVEPWDVIDAHGADAFRWYYLTSQQPWAGYRFSVDTVGESVRQFLLTLWNTYSFWVLYANAEGLGPTPTSAAPPEAERATSTAGRSRGCRRRSRRSRERMDDFDCTAAGRAIADYVEELSNWYVRLSRRRFWEGDRAAFATLRHCLLETAALLAPFTPFLADEIHLNLAGGEAEEFGELPDSVHLRDFPEADPALADPELEAAMEAVRRTVELGRAARAQAKAKVRQPLRRAVIVANDAEREAIEARADLVTAELNVKELDFVSEEAELVSYAVKPNYRALGPRFGKQMPQVAAAVEALDAAHVAARHRRGRRDRDQHRRRTTTRSAPTRSPSPCSRSRATRSRPRPATPSPSQLELDDELRREGLAREIVHAVQNARKDAGLEITDRIELTLGGDAELLEAAREHEAYVAGEVLATSVAYDGGRRRRGDDRRPRAAIGVTGLACAGIGRQSRSACARRHLSTAARRLKAASLHARGGEIAARRLGRPAYRRLIAVGARRRRATLHRHRRYSIREPADLSSCAHGGSAADGIVTPLDRRASSPAAGSPMMKSDFVESENFTQQCSGATPATSISAASIRLAISAFCSSVRPSYQWTWTNGMRPARRLGERRLELGLEAALRHRADDFLRDRAVLEEDQRRDREDLVLGGRLLVLVDVEAERSSGRRARRRSPRGPGGRRGTDRTRAPRSRRARARRPRAPRL